MKKLYILILLVNLVGCVRPCCLHGCEIKEWKKRGNYQQQTYEDWLIGEMGMEEIES